MIRKQFAALHWRHSKGTGAGNKDCRRRKQTLSRRFELLEARCLLAPITIFFDGVDAEEGITEPGTTESL